MDAFDLQSLADARVAELRAGWVAATQPIPRRRLAIGERLRAAFTGWVDLPELPLEAAGRPRP